MLECHCANTERGNFGEKSSLTVEFICVLAFCVFVKKVIPTGHIETPGNPRAWCSVEKDLTVRLKYTS